MKTRRSKTDIGRSGEQQAATFLQQQGYQILETNFTAVNKEIDIIALDRQADELVFVEVKTRSTSAYGHPARAVDRQKFNNLLTAARTYLNRAECTIRYRFDIIAILPDRVEQFKNISMEI